MLPRVCTRVHEISRLVFVAMSFLPVCFKQNKARHRVERAIPLEESSAFRDTLNLHVSTTEPSLDVHFACRRNRRLLSSTSMTRSILPKPVDVTAGGPCRCDVQTTEKHLCESSADTDAAMNCCFSS